MIFSESRLYMAMQGCDLVVRVGAQKSIWTFSRTQKSESLPRLKVCKKMIFIRSLLCVVMQG